MNFEYVSKLHQQVKPLLAGTMIPRMPYWWCPSEERTAWNVSRFLLSHLLVWGGFGALVAWLFTPWIALVYAAILTFEIAKFLLQKKLPQGSMLEAFHGGCIGIIYAALGALAILFASAFIVDMNTDTHWWRAIGIGIVTVTTYIGLNAGQGLKPHLRRGRTSHAGVILQIVHASMPVFVVAGLVFRFREFLGSVWPWGLLLIIGLVAGTIQQGLGEYRYRMKTRELTRAFAIEFAKSFILLGLANGLLYSLSRLPTPDELLILWLVPSLILFDVKTERIAEWEYAEWRSKAYSLAFSLQDLKMASNRLGQNTALLVQSLKRYPTHILRAFTWRPIMLSPSVPSGQNPF